MPKYVANGIATGEFFRNGGVIQDQSGRVVTWLKDAAMTSSISPSVMTGVDPTGALRLLVQATDSAVTQQRLGAISRQVGQLQNMVMFQSAASFLTLGVTAIGFAVIYKKLQKLEGRLQEVQKKLEEIDEKIDLAFYANFRAALGLARNAFEMSNAENRRGSAMQAIDRFLEAEHVYADLADKELERHSQIGDEYLLTLCLAYIAETQCYLELGEYGIARSRFEEAKHQIKSRMEKYVDILLTPNPLMYLHPKLSGKVDLSRLTRIYQWKDSRKTENLVFEELRESFGNMIEDIDHIQDWAKQLPSSIMEQQDIKRGFFGLKKEGRAAIFEQLPRAVEEMEEMIETTRRFESYEYEIKLLEKTKVPYSKWHNATPAVAPPESSSLIFVTPPSPLYL